MAQRDSAVSDYKSCAEEPAAQSAPPWGRDTARRSSGGTETVRRVIFAHAETEFFVCLFFLSRSISDKKHKRSEDILPFAHLCVLSFLTTVLTGTRHAASVPY